MKIISTLRIWRGQNPTMCQTTNSVTLDNQRRTLYEKGDLQRTKRWWYRRRWMIKKRYKKQRLRGRQSMQRLIGLQTR